MLIIFKSPLINNECGFIPLTLNFSLSAIIHCLVRKEPYEWQYEKGSGPYHFSKLVETINVLHKHLPDKIPDVESASAQRGTIVMKRNVTCIVTSSGKAVTVAPILEREALAIIKIFNYFINNGDWVVFLPFKTIVGRCSLGFAIVLIFVNFPPSFFINR